MRRRLLSAVLLTMVIAPFASAALPPLSLTERNEKAALVITGRVVGSRTLTVRKPSSTVLLVRLLAEVESTEKGGPLIEGSRHIDIRCRKIVATKIVGSVGHTDIPAEGSHFRMWLVQNTESQWEPLEPNGIELLGGSSAMVFREPTTSRSLRDYAAGGIVGIATFIALAIFLWRRRAIR